MEDLNEENKAQAKTLEFLIEEGEVLLSEIRGMIGELSGALLRTKFGDGSSSSGI